MSPGGPGVHAQGRQGALGLFQWRKGLRSCKVPARSPHRWTWGAQAPNGLSKMALHIFPKLESQADVTDTAFFEAGMRKYLMLLVRNIKCFLEILGVVLPLLSQVTKTDPRTPKQVCSLKPYWAWRPGSDTGRIGRVAVCRGRPPPFPRTHSQSQAGQLTFSRPMLLAALRGLEIEVPVRAAGRREAAGGALGAQGQGQAVSYAALQAQSRQRPHDHLCGEMAWLASRGNCGPRGPLGAGLQMGTQPCPNTSPVRSPVRLGCS